MANAPAVLVFELEPPIPFTVADGASIEKGDFLQLADLATVSLVSGDDQKIAGIAAEEKVASDGKVKIGVYRKGIFKVEAADVVTVGYTQVLKAKNEVEDYDTLDGEVGKKCGQALETATNGEFFLLDLSLN